MPNGQVAPTSIPLCAALPLRHGFALPPFSYYRGATTGCPVPRFYALSRAWSPFFFSLAYVACLYPTGPPATPWRGPKGMFRA